jgi:hypothetical protein
MGKFTRGAIVVAVIVAARLIYPTHTRGDMHSKVHDRLVEICAGDGNCVSAVDTNFESCFDTEWSRPSSEFDMENMASCVNDKSGQTWFTSH